MLATIGVASIDELFRDIPAGVRLDRELDLEPALSEEEVFAHLGELAGRQRRHGRELSFLGAGIYDHYVPAVVDTRLQRGEFLTAYTPYQPEMSQGVLQAIFEYQTAICELTGMDVSNASGYDGTTVAADACFVAKHATGREQDRRHRGDEPAGAPGREDLRARLRPRDRRGAASRRDDRPRRGSRAAADAAAVIFQQPNVFGCLEPAPGARGRGERRRGARDRARRPAVARRARGAGPLRLRARDRRRAGSGELPGLSAARTTASSPRARSSSGACPDGSSARR